MVEKDKPMENLSNEYLNDRFLQLAEFLQRFHPKRIAVKILLIYLIIGVSWVLLSDKILSRLISDPKIITTISTIKGWFYVLVTGIVLYYLVLSSLNRIRSVNQDLLRNYEELAAVYEELTASELELQKKVEMLTESEERYRLVSEATNDGIWDEKYGERYFSERWYEITGYTRDEISEINDWMTLIHPDDIGMVKQKLEWHKKNRDPYYRCEYRLKHKNGEYRWIYSRAKLIFDENGEIVRSAGSHTDITELKNYQEQLKHLAFIDFLTDIPNRTSFYQTVISLLNQYPERKMALMFIDIDNFKYINDTIGHISGDKLIVNVAKRLKVLMNNNRSVYRIGGDEFVVFIHHYENTDEIEELAEEIVNPFKKPFEFSDLLLNVTASIGIALYPLHGNDVDTLLMCADIAMYKAKSVMRGKYAFYNRDMDRIVNERMILENELRFALDKEEFELYYQPQFDIESNRICSFEVLLRWKNQRLGLVSPEKFIKIAEETHLINPIGDWVFRNSCKFIKELLDKGYTDITVSVNVSIIQLMQEDFVDKLMEIISQTGVNPECLELEITESAIIESYEEIKGKLEDLISKGIRVALDDFGKGYSSLSCLVHIPITTLKIDKSFIDTIDSEKSLASTIIMIGRKLGLTVVAEGVETEAQLEYLKKYKCHRVQGYYLSKPITHADVLKMLYIPC